MTAPATATTTPSASLSRNRSFSSNGAIIQFDTSATTPRGDTIEAGANPYARKFPASPTVMSNMPPHQYGELKYVFPSSRRGFSECLIEESDELGEWRDVFGRTVPSIPF